MSSETQKQFVLKLFVAIGIVCMAWLFLIKPVNDEADAQRETLNIHQSQIDSYQMNYGEIDPEKTVELKKRLADVYETMSSILVHGDTGTSLHDLINQTASKYGVSMTRIESGNSTNVKRRIGDSETEIRGINHVVRIEFEGDYSSAVAFMDALVSSPFSVNVANFRFLPSGFETVHATAEVSSVMLASIPAGADEGGAINE